MTLAERELIQLTPEQRRNLFHLYDTSYIVSWDLAQGGADFNALVVLERTQNPRSRIAQYAITWLERYRDRRTARIPERTAEVFRRLAERHRAKLFHASYRDDPTPPRITLVIDQTGIGPFGLDPLVERGFYPIGITITGGDAVTRPPERPNEFRVPKRDLASAVYNLLESRRLLISSQLPDADTLRAELGNFRIKISPTGHDRYEAGSGGELWREGAHDDLVLSVACGVWLGEFAPEPTLDPAMLEAWGDLPGVHNRE